MMYMKSKGPMRITFGIGKRFQCIFPGPEERPDVTGNEGEKKNSDDENPLLERRNEGHQGIFQRKVFDRLFLQGFCR